MDSGSLEALRDRTRPLPDSDGTPAPAVGASLVDNSGPTVVGLGEATHGTRECFELKARFVRQLVERGVVRTVAFEADVAAAAGLDAYVRRGEGTPGAALDGLEKWLYRTESVRELLVWLRSFNRDRPAGDRVRVRGVDLSRPAAPAALLRETLEEVTPADAAESDALARLADASVPDDADARARTLDRVEAAAATVEERLERNEREIPAERREWARHLCRVVRRTCDWNRVRHGRPGPHAAGMEARDEHMAANVEWCLERDPLDGVAVWAHNGHVKRGRFDDGRPWTDATTMGECLARAFGDSYTPVGFDVGRGTFRAVPATEAGAEPRRFTLDQPADGSATARFAAVGGSPWLLDVGAAAADPRLRDWFDQSRQIRRVGTVYDPTSPDDHYLRTDLTDFDALAFVDRSTPSHPVE